MAAVVVMQAVAPRAVARAAVARAVETVPVGKGVPAGMEEAMV